MRLKFHYLTDTLFIFSLILYAINKFVFLRPFFFETKFNRYYLNDLLLVPVLLPIILFISKTLNIRNNNQPPIFIEIIIPLVIWSISFEIIGPYYFKHSTSDPVDIIAYFFGGGIGWLIWNKIPLPQLHSKHYRNQKKTVN